MGIWKFERLKIWEKLKNWLSFWIEIWQINTKRIWRDNKTVWVDRYSSQNYVKMSDNREEMFVITNETICGWRKIDKINSNQDQEKKDVEFLQQKDKPTSD